jgi:hypothetical protein
MSFTGMKERRGVAMTGTTHRFINTFIVVFAALTLTHAAFVDYRVGGEIQTKFRSRYYDPALYNAGYLQTRKYADVEPLYERAYCADRNRANRWIWWRGQTRREWTESGLCCGVFDMLVKTKGGRTRTRLLGLLDRPKNRLQLASEIGIDWKAVDRHVAKLLEYNLIRQIESAPNCRMYLITEKGSRALALAEKVGISYSCYNPESDTASRISVSDAVRSNLPVAGAF